MEYIFPFWQINIYFMNENQIEQLAIDRLKAIGYDYIYAPSIAPDSQSPERSSFEQVLLLGRLQNAVSRINPGISRDIQAEAIKDSLLKEYRSQNK